MKARCIFRMYIWGKQQLLYENFCPCTSLKARTPQHACYVALFTEMKEAVQLAFQENNVSLHHEQQSFSVDIENNGVTDHKGIRTSGSKNSPALHHPFLNTLSKVSNGNDFFKN